ncbi:BCCT family transporter [Sulfitobacter donghicola]|uniref:Choline transporter n=1 Tax=Sulfitobacter donghicola DSW-25 = KCTC 12864 = JCM 14565 TaxID=1300350 RepID=A0A073IWZ9_9RHOB|nr:BCCT family transporter [Sulfitobacter donghicola]KEJ89907.1 choline transporter [Sulfitobacter donghicola DSW-25 = KCTC 12864 = JCM 14565]KIN66968.1 Transporter, BCCT family [Sulfitobacter donghicola DSW-25 = KCTC 12864 = JCM 14565]
MLLSILTFGIIMAFALVIFITIKWWNLTLVGKDPVPLMVFIAILFTSGLDVGLIMFPVAFDFPLYADVATNPTFGFTNPLAIEFGMWGFLIWAFYFLTGFYFCVIEPRVKFFDIPLVKLVNNIVIVGTCAFTGSLFLQYLPYYMPMVGDGESIIPLFYVMTFLVICAAAYSSTDIKFVKFLSVASSMLFFVLILFAWVNGGAGVGGFFADLGNVGGYFTNIHRFILPMGDEAGYHEFFLFWWFAWSIMIGQFTSRFVGGLKTWQFLAALLVIPSIPLAIWFAVLYHYFTAGVSTEGLMNWAMIVVGVIFVINSFDSLIRLYTDNLGLTVQKLGKATYLAGNIVLLSVLTYAFKSGWLQISWIGAVVVGIMAAAVVYILARRRREVMAIDSMPEGQTL